MPSANDILQDALEKIGVYASGETMSDADAERGLIVLNDMIDSWSNESLTCFTILEQSFQLIPGKASYTIGTVGTPDINQTRPIRIAEGPGAAYTQDTNGNNYYIEVMTRVGWNQIGNRSQITANIPGYMFYDPQFPLGVLNWFPVPNQGQLAFWDSYQQLSEFPDLSTSLSFPLGYAKAIKDNVALELVPYFKSDTFQVPPLWIDIANKSKGNVKRANTRNNLMVYDPELSQRATATYNVYRDSY